MLRDDMTLPGWNSRLKVLTVLLQGGGGGEGRGRQAAGARLEGAGRRCRGSLAGGT
mgnify:CR=1 FL=1